MKILLVDDDEAIQEVYAKVLKDAGYEVDVAADGKHGQEMLKTKEYDCILLDELLPDMTGNQMLSLLKADEKTSNIPVIIISNFNMEQSIKEALGLGADDYVLKYNIDPSDIVKKVQQTLEGKKPQKAI